MPATSNRILYDVPCGVCRDNSSGKHYGVFACDGCAGFFKRSVRRERNYVCKARLHGTCMIDKTHRNQCRFCRLSKCLEAGMNKDAVQHERGPRNSTIRRQMALFSKDMMSSQEIGHPINMQSPTMPMPILPPPAMPIPLTIFSHPPFTHYNGLNMFNAPLVPPFVPPVFPMSPHFIHGNIPEKQCEGAARLLFLNVSMTKQIAPFESLSLADRLLLLENSWAEIFVLSVAQYLYPIDLNVLFGRGRARIDYSSVDVFKTVLVEIDKIKPDPEEYMYLRAIILFKTNIQASTDNSGRNSMPAHSGDIRRLQDLPAVAEMQSRLQAALHLHTTNAYPGQPSRPSQMQQILTLVKRVSGTTITELFFRNTIGDITGERIITDVYMSGRIPVIPFNM